MDLSNFMDPGSRPKGPIQTAEKCGVMEPVKPRVSNWKPKYEVEQWSPSELDDWIEECRMSGEDYEYIIVKFMLNLKENRACLTFAKHYFGSKEKESSMNYEEDIGDLLCEYVQRVQSAKIPYVPGLEQHQSVGRHWKLCNQRIFSSAKAQVFLERKGFDARKFIEAWNNLQDIQASEEHKDLVKKNLFLEKSIDEAKEKLSDVESAVRNMFGLGNPFCYGNAEKKTPLWLFGKTVNELKEIHEALKKRIADLEKRNGETEARLGRLVPNTLVGYSIPFCVDDYDSDIDYSFYEHIGKFRGKNSDSQVGVLREC